jgi:hypothetical protein
VSAPYAVVVTSELEHGATPNVYGPLDLDEADALAKRILETNEHVNAVAVPLLPWADE